MFTNCIIKNPKYDTDRAVKDTSRLANFLVIDADTVSNWPKLLYLPAFRDNYGSVDTEEKELLANAFPNDAPIAWDIDESGRIILLIRTIVDRYFYDNSTQIKGEEHVKKFVQQKPYYPQESLITIYERCHMMKIWRMHTDADYFHDGITGTKYQYVVKAGNIFVANLIAGKVANVNKFKTTDGSNLLPYVFEDTLYYAKGEEIQKLTEVAPEYEHVNYFFVTIKGE